MTDLDPSETGTVNYRVREGNYQLEVIFQSGKRLQTDTVYVAPGVDYQDEIIVTASEIHLTHEPVRSR